ELMSIRSTLGYGHLGQWRGPSRAFSSETERGCMFCFFLSGLTALIFACPVAAAVKQPHGFYLMQSLHVQSVKASILTSPQISGIHLRDAWDLVEPSPGTFSFSWLDGQLAR